jgi:hypothetical protein
LRFSSNSALSISLARETLLENIERARRGGDDIRASRDAAQSARSRRTAARSKAPGRRTSRHACGKTWINRPIVGSGKA